MLRFAILGCGPAGLMAAHAVALTGHNVEIISKGGKSKQYGAQWLHESVPGVTSVFPEDYISVEHRGDADTYAKKVYGDTRFPTSFGEWGDPELGVTDLPIWDLRKAYDKLWRYHADKIIDRDLDCAEVESIVEGGTYDRVISSVPRRAICRSFAVDSDKGDVPELHEFHSQKVWVKPAELDQSNNPNGNFVIYNGDTSPSWYRSSVVFGQGMLEWGDYIPGGKPPFEGIVPVEKPLAHSCTCWPDITHVGRFGEWRKGVLTHHAFETALEAAEAVSV